MPPSSCPTLFFLWLPNAELAVSRVENRVRQGGHGVPPEDIRRRYAAGVKNLLGLYWPLIDAWWLYDAARLPPRLIAHGENESSVVKQKGLYRQFKRQVGEFDVDSN